MNYSVLSSRSLQFYRLFIFVSAILFFYSFVDIAKASSSGIGRDNLKNVYAENSDNISKQSYYSLTFSNGYSAGIYDAQLHKLTTFTDMIYWFRDPQTERKNLLKEAYFGVKLENGETIWLKDITEKSLEYFEESGIIFATYSIDGMILECYYFAPFTSGKHNIVMMAVLKDAGNKKIVDFIDCDSSVLTSRSENRIGGDLHYQVTLNLGGENLEEASLEKEINFWQTFHSVEPAISDKYKKLYRQSTAFLKMAQCRENGQILASLPPGEWSIAWTRDMCYAIAGLINSNHFKEARFGMEFLLNGKANQFKHFYYMGKDYGVGMDYFISICRYFGNGLEWSDEMFNQRPKPVNETIDPNIEFDGFGLFLWVFSEYVKKCKDIDFLKDNIDKLKLTGENILGLIDKEVNLIKKDSSIWESHLVLAKHYLYTSITSAKGLKELAALCGLVDEDASKYIEGYNILIQGIKSNTDKNGYLKGSFEEKVRYYDAAVVEAINFDLVDDYIGTNTIKGFEDKLYNGKGFKRTDNVGTYDRMEWIFINLRIASAYLKYGERQKALNLIDRTQNIAKVNYNIIPELYDGNDGCAGQIPMMGYGSAAFINALYSLVNN